MLGKRAIVLPLSSRRDLPGSMQQAMSDSRHATISPAAPTFKTMGGGNQPLRIQLCKVGSTQDREEFGSNQDFDAACDPRLSTDQPGSFEGEHHLMDGWWADAKVALQIGFGWRTAEDVRIGVDECQILTLLGCEAWTSWRRRQVCPQFGSRGCRPSRI